MTEAVTRRSDDAVSVERAGVAEIRPTASPPAARGAVVAAESTPAEGGAATGQVLGTHQHRHRHDHHHHRKGGRRHRARPSGSSSSSSERDQSGSESSGSDDGDLPRRLRRHGGSAHRHHWGQPGSRVTASYRQLDTLSSTHQYTISG